MALNNNIIKENNKGDVNVVYTNKLNKVLDTMYINKSDKTLEHLLDDCATTNCDVATLKGWLDDTDYSSEDIIYALTYHQELDDRQPLDKIMQDYDNGNIMAYDLGDDSYGCFSDDEALGYTLVDMGYYTIPDELASYIDYDAMGRDFELETNGTFIYFDDRVVYLFRQ